jgi:hypothetical protein
MQFRVIYLSHPNIITTKARAVARAARRILNATVSIRVKERKTRIPNAARDPH